MPKQSLCKKKIVVGVTGVFGSGKTTVCGILNSLGAEVVDADQLAHRLLRQGTPTHKEVVAVFGEAILNKKRGIDRKNLAQRVFPDKKMLLKLNKILHPGIIKMIKKRIRHSQAKIVVLDAPLLLEAGLGNSVDSLVVVKISKVKQMERIKKRDHLRVKDIVRRTQSQMPLSQKMRLADFIIDNGDCLAKTRKQVENIWKRIHAPCQKRGSLGRLLWKN